MSSFRYHRCNHCFSQYEYQASGCGLENQIATAQHCETCAKVILDALAQVPRKFRRSRQPTTEVTLDQLLLWEKERAAECSDRVVLDVRRIAFPSFNLDHPTLQNRTEYVVGRAVFSGRTYLYSYWAELKGPPTQVQVFLVTEENLETGEHLPWLSL